MLRPHDDTTATGAPALIDSVFREQWGRVLASRSASSAISNSPRRPRRSLRVAAERWPRDGVPDQPGRLADARPRATARSIASAASARSPPRRDAAAASTPSPWTDATRTKSVPDERLELVFTCCHPALALEAQVALTLRALGGLETEEIARAFLVSARRWPSADPREAKIKTAGIPFRCRPTTCSPDRLARRARGRLSDLQRGLRRARRTGGGGAAPRGALAELMPDEPEVHGLLALMLSTTRAARPASRRGARAARRPGPSLWDTAQLAAGRAGSIALALRGAASYVVQAAIASLQPGAEIDWARSRSVRPARRAHPLAGRRVQPGRRRRPRRRRRRRPRDPESARP